MGATGAILVTLTILPGAAILFNAVRLPWTHPYFLPLGAFFIIGSISYLFKSATLYCFLATPVIAWAAYQEAALHPELEYSLLMCIPILGIIIIGVLGSVETTIAYTIWAMIWAWVMAQAYHGPGDAGILWIVFIIACTITLFTQRNHQSKWSCLNDDLQGAYRTLDELRGEARNLSQRMETKHDP